jgi:SanA protein
MQIEHIAVWVENLEKMRIFTPQKIEVMLIASVILLMGITVIVCDNIIDTATDDLIFSKTENLPYNRAGLVLGTSKYLKSGQENMYFTHRIDAAVSLYQAGKIDVFVISGDNSKETYNEPLDMKNELIRKNIPENRIYLDYAGFRTYDSVIRMNKIFGQKSFTVISQEFHNRRAIYIANRTGLYAIGYNAKDVLAYTGLKTKIREKFARVKVFIDFLVRKEPKFLGEPVKINFMNC